MNHAAPVNFVRLTDAAVAVLPLATTHAELDEWWKESQSWIRSIKENAPEQYARLVEAGKAHREKLNKGAVGSSVVRRIGGSSDRWSRPRPPAG